MFLDRNRVKLAGRSAISCRGPDRSSQAAGVKVILTGHPPPLEQISGQVRTPTGMTFGKRLADGRAVMPGAFTRVEIPAPSSRRDPDGIVGMSMVVMKALREWAEAGERMPHYNDLYRRFGRDFMVHFWRLRQIKAIRLYVEAAAASPAIAVCLCDTDQVLRSPDLSATYPICWS